MSITGNLKTMELAELLQWLSGARKTGTLVVDIAQRDDLNIPLFTQRVEIRAALSADADAGHA